MRRTLLLCCNSVFGMVHFRGGVIRHLVERGFRVVVVAPSDRHVPALLALGAEHRDWRLVGRGVRPVQEWASLRQLRRLYLELRPALAFHFTIKAVVYGAFAARATGTPFVSILTGLGYAFINDNWVSRIAVRLYRMTLHRSREVWLLNRRDETSLRQLGLLKDVTVRILPGEGVDTRHYASTGAPAPHTGVHFLMIARLLRDKGVVEFVEAARRLRAADPLVRCSLLGEAGADNPTAIGADEIAAWVAEGAVAYLGTATDVRLHIAAADCVVLPSYREGMPRTLLEASAMERPVVATDVPGCNDVVVNGETGFLCRARDAVDLARAMQDIVTAGPAGRRRMGRLGRRHVQARFDEALVLRHYDEIVDSIWPAHHGRGTAPAETGSFALRTTGSRDATP